MQEMLDVNEEGMSSRSGFETGGHGGQCGHEWHWKLYLPNDDVPLFLLAMYNGYAAEIRPWQANATGWEGSKLGSRGLMQMSQGSNALIVRDTEGKVGVMKQLIDGLELEVPQVQIEARIVQADTTYTRSLGVQWGVQNVNQLSGGAVANFKSGTTGGFGGQTSNFLVNLPATVGGLTSTPGVGFTIGKADGAVLDMRLSAGELLGLSKVIAAPKVTTLDKREAKISQGESIRFQTTSLQGTQTTFVDATWN